MYSFSRVSDLNVRTNHSVSLMLSWDSIMGASISMNLAFYCCQTQCLLFLKLSVQLLVTLKCHLPLLSHKLFYSRRLVPF